MQGPTIGLPPVWARRTALAGRGGSEKGMIVLMISSARTQNPVTLSERLLITKIITSVGLALLLLVGAWTATHVEPEKVSSVSSAATELVEAHATSVAPGLNTIEHSAGGSSLLGAAACVFGMLCGLLLLAVASRWWSCTRVPLDGKKVLPLIRALPSRVLIRSNALSLTQLGISRT